MKLERLVGGRSARSPLRATRLTPHCNQAPLPVRARTFELWARRLLISALQALHGYLRHGLEFDLHLHRILKHQRCGRYPELVILFAGGGIDPPKDVVDVQCQLPRIRKKCDGMDSRVMPVHRLEVGMRPFRSTASGVHGASNQSATSAPLVGCSGCWATAGLSASSKADKICARRCSSPYSKKIERRTLSG